MFTIDKSHKLDDVCYDIRGPVHKEARRLEDEGHRILKLNIGNPAPFGFDAPEEIIKDVILNMPLSQGYCDSKGLFSARKAVMQYYQQKGMRKVDIDDIYIGNGASELIVMAMQALLNNGDEMLVPSPTTRSGLPPSPSPVAMRCTTAATKGLTGIRISTTSAPASPRALAAWC